MDAFRPNPDKLLEQVKENDYKRQRGKLKIFFGYAAGVGKTYAMLQSAHMAKEAGIDVVAGYIEPHARPETLALLEGMEQLPPLQIPYRNLTLQELDLDAAIRRNPRLILVDELAHTNAYGCRHAKRYQDVEELLKAGIDVYTTVNVQHIESLNDLVASITGVVVQERIPDFVFDNADQIELVDIEPEELLQRLRQGKIYRSAQADKAMEHFFSIGNLTALREIALRRTADQVNQLAGKSNLLGQEPAVPTDEHILICLSPSPSNAKVIRAAARMVSAFKAKFTAVYVEQPDKNAVKDADAARLQQNIRLAEQLGAKVVTLYGGDLVKQIAGYVNLAGVSKIVLGRSYTKARLFHPRENFAQQLTDILPNKEIFLIPDSNVKQYAAKRSPAEPKLVFRLQDVLALAGCLGLASVVSAFFSRMGFGETNIVTIYILGVLCTAILTDSRIYSFLASALSVLLFNFLFIEPVRTLEVNNLSYYAVTFLVMFLAGLLTATLAKQVKGYGKQATMRAYRMETLLETSQKLQTARTPDKIIEILAGQLVKLLNKDVVIYLGDPAAGRPPACFPAEGDCLQALLTKDERAVAAWSYQNNKHAGATTNTLPGAKGLYLAIRNGDDVFGVVGIYVNRSSINAFEEGILSAILNEGALALENERMIRDKNKAVLQMQQEQLRANLLRSISHDLKTPLTSISGNAEMLMSQADRLTAEQRRQTYEAISDDALWLINLVENLLSVTRIENGTMQLNLQPELLEEVIDEALIPIRRRRKKHALHIRLEDSLLMAKMDAKLMMQVIMNLVDNAMKYTPPDAEITASAKRDRGRILVEVADTGAGIPDALKGKIFDMFFTANKPVADSGRSMGIGLALCKSIVNAHGSTLEVADNVPHGAVFRFSLEEERVDV